MTELYDANAVVIYTTRLCGYCQAAKRLLASKQVDFREVPADGDQDLRVKLVEQTGQRTVPQIWIGQQHIGGYTDLAELEQGGKLDQLLAAL